MKWITSIPTLSTLVVAAATGQISTTSTLQMLDTIEGGGLYFQGSDSSKGGFDYVEQAFVATTLRSLQVTGRIVDGIAEVTMVQEFQTPAFFPENFESNTAVYRVPLDESAAVTAFRAEVDGRTIEAVVKEREQAREEFEAAVLDGKNAYLAEQIRADLFHLSVGNMPRNKIVRVTLVYVTTLETLSGNTVRFVFPTAVASRYEPFENSEGGIPDGLDMIHDGVQIGLDVSMAVSIDEITSNTHAVQVDKSADDTDHTATVRITDENTTNRDVVILIRTMTNYEPNIYVESSKKYGTTAIMLSIVPDISKDLIGASDDDLNQEYIFILDRSGSMGGTRMDQTKQAMLLILDELPEDAIFNIVGFGTDFQALFTSSRKISDQSAKSLAVTYVNDMDADLGGTEILAPLQSVLGQERLSSYERLVFVVTDGEVSNTDDIIEYVRSRRSAGRVFSLGIGEHVSALLVQGIARAGRGTAEFVDGESVEAIESAVRRQMEVAVLPALTDVDIEWGLPTAAAGQQAPYVTPPLLSGKRFLAFYLLPHGGDDGDVVLPETVRISSKVFNTDAVVKYEVEASSFLLLSTSFKEGEEEESDLIHKIACRSLIRDLEEGGSELHDANASEEDIRKEIVRLGLKYQIASSETSFVAVVEDVNSMMIRDKEDGIVQSARTKRGYSSSSSWTPRHLFWILELSCVAVLSYFMLY